MIAFGGVALLISLVMLAVQPKPIPGVGLSQRQDAETAVYVAAFGLVLPLALVTGPRLADRIAAGPNGTALSSLTALLTSTLMASILLVRLSEELVEWGGEMGTLLGAVGLWAIAATMALARAARARRWRSLLRIAHLAAPLWLAGGALALVALLTVTHLDSLSLLPLALGAVLIPAVVLLVQHGGIPRLLGPRGWAVECLVVVLLLLAVPDLVVFTPEDPASSLDAYRNSVIQFHQDFLLGPANQVLGGGPMLVDTASQYGVGSILFLVGWFKLAPIGYGTLALLDGLLTALFLGAGYCVLRVAGASRSLSVASLALAVVVLVLNRPYPVGALPQEGPLRFGLPLALILVTLAGVRWPRHSAPARMAALVLLGLSSLWAIETFALTAVTFAVMACFEAGFRPAGRRLGWLARQAGFAVAACAAAHLVFIAATLVGTGQLPDWGQYLAYLDAFFVGSLGEITYDFSRWSPALAIGGLYLTSAAALVLLVRRSRGFFRRERIALLALTATTAYGILLYGYYVDRSGDHIIAYVSLPALLTGALWLSVLLRSRARLSRGVGTGALAFALSVAVLLVAVAWSSVGSRLQETALAQFTPGGDSGRKAVDRLWHFPPVDARVLEGERLLDTYMPGERRTPVLVRPSLATETLMRSGRANRLWLASPVGDSWVMDAREPFVRDAVSDLRLGDRMLLDKGLLAALAEVRADPTSKLLKQVPVGAATAPLQVFALRRIDERFRLRTIRTDREGFVVVELVPRH